MRFATVGVSGRKIINNKLSDWELELVLPTDLGGASEDKVSNYVLDIMAYSLEKNVTIEEGASISQSPLAPEEWSTKAVLFDEARGEPEELSFFDIGRNRVKLLWIVPITGEERSYIKEHGLHKFDEKVEETECALIDVNRPSIVSL